MALILTYHNDLILINVINQYQTDDSVVSHQFDQRKAQDDRGRDASDAFQLDATHSHDIDNDNEIDKDNDNHVWLKLMITASLQLPQ